MNLITRIKNYFRPLIWDKLPAVARFRSKKKGMMTYDEFSIDFDDNGVHRAYILRPVGMPLPLIVDELRKITGSLETAMDIYRKFGQAASNCKTPAFKVKIKKLF